ncbi:unnamed protein product [Linum trigynum]|uniref:Uncharacterized protein n=1 Tax=Linum trigynum TaxID=586398 RepID=A0AAV2D151_9ROSI
MVVDTMRIAVDGKRYSLLTIKMCSRWIRRHPVLVSALCVLVFLYRSFPFCFSVLVSASPVLFCTAILLGTLLSFGEPHIPEIDLHNPELVATTSSTHHDVNLFEKHGLTSSEEDHVTVVQRADNEVGSVVEMKGSVIEEEDGRSKSCSPVVVVEEKSREIQFAEQVEKVFSELEMKLRKKEENGGGVGENHQYARVGDLGDKDDNGKLGNGENDDGGVTMSVGEFLASQSGNRSMEEKEEEECEECSEDSGSDGAESSSPDASIADIMPMLDELHPLLDEEAPQQGLISRYGSASEGSQRNRDSSSVDSEEDSGNHVDEEEEEEEGVESEGAQTGKEDESKSAIVWTEDDTKNLMDLGTSELERNQRLESLIARRRARRNSRAVIEKEKNLIDFDGGGDLHFNVPHISTSRRNPFDLPYDSYDDAPGSAPSIMLKRRNPFDLPYDSGEEKPDLKGESSDMEFAGFQHREQQPGPVFRRHDSFNVGPSYLGGFVLPPPNKQDRLDVLWKPYFLPERFVHNHEGTTTSSSNFPGGFQRQLSEISESKMSSIPDTESVISVLEEEEDKKKLISEKDVHHEMESEELIANNVDTSSVLVEHGSLSSSSVDGIGDNDAEPDERRRDIHHHHEADIEEMNTSEILLRMVEPDGDEEYSSPSSLSSSSEPGDDKITDGQKVLLTNHEMKVEVPTTQTLLHVNSHPENDGPRVSTDTLDRHSIGSTVDESKHEEPVFDSSPPELDKFLSFSSISSDIQAEIAEMAEKAYLSKKGLLQLNQDDRLDLSSSRPSTTAEQDEEVKVVTLRSSDHEVQWSEKSMVGPSYGNHELLEPSVRNIKSVPKDSELTLERSSPTEAFWSPESAGSFNFEEDEMKEIDEGLLSELDTVGDFRVKEVDGEQQIMLQNGGVSTSEPLVKQISSNLQDAGTEHSLENTKQLPETVDEDIHTRELPVLEVRSTEDIDMAFKQLHEGAEVEEVILPSTIKLQQSLEDKDTFGSPDVQPSTPLQVIEARFVDDIHVALTQQAPKGSDKNLPERSDSLQVTTEGTSMTELPVLEVRTAEDIDLAFKQLHEGAEVEEVIIPSTIKQQQSLEEENEFGSPNAQPSTPMQVVEAKIVEDIDFAVMQRASNGSSHKDLPEPSNSESRQLSEDDLSISNKELPVLEVKTAEDIDLAFKQLHEGAEIEEVILPSAIKQQSLEDEFGSPNVQPSTPLQVVDAKFLEDIHAAVGQQASKSRDKTPQPSESTAIQPSEKEIFSTELPVLEVRTAEDIDLAFKQLHEGAEVEDVILPSTIEQQSADDEFRSPSEQPSTPLQVVEARFLEDIRAAVMQQGSKGSDRDFPESSTTGFQVTTEEEEIHDKELPVLEVRTAQDIDLAFKQLHEGAKLEEVILPSSIEQQAAAEDEFRSPSEQPSTPLVAVEARFIEDIHTAIMHQVSKGSEGELPEPSDFVGTQVKAKEVTDKELPVLEVRTAEDIEVAFKQLHEGAELEEVILPSTIKQQSLEDEFRSPDEQPSTPLQVVEAKHIDEIHAAVQEIASKSKVPSFPAPSDSAESQLTEEHISGKVLPLLEVKTAEDIDLAFKQLREGAEVEEVILPSTIKQQSEEYKLGSPNEPPSTPLPVVEARFVEDIDAAVMHQSSKGSAMELPEVSDSALGQAESTQADHSHPNDSRNPEGEQVLPVLEVRTAEDIDLAFKQLHEGAEVNEVIVPSHIKQRSLEEDEFRSPNEQPSTPLQVVDARFVEDIHTAVMQHASKDNDNEVQKTF